MSNNSSYMAIFNGKTIILGAPKHYNLDGVIEAELNSLGFKTINISFFDNQFQYKNRFQRLKSFFYREVLGDKTYKTKLKFDENRQWLEAEMAAIRSADYALIIRPDVYPIDFINLLRKKVKKLIGYQWDGLDRFPSVYHYISLFDRFFVFDGHDLEVPSVLPITNYYPSAFKNLYDERLQSDVFFSGSFSKQRIADLGRIVQDCRSLNQNAHYHLYHRKTCSLPTHNLVTTSKALSYEENIRRAYNTKVILDIVNPAHDGLSLRVFEALGFKKKLVTTNRWVKQYDFYHPDNIMVWDNSSLDELRAFLDSPYSPLSDEIMEKYSFKNWLNYALDQGEYTQLSVPCS